MPTAKAVKHKGHTYVYVDAVGDDGCYIHDPNCHCQEERERIQAEWDKIDNYEPKG